MLGKHGLLNQTKRIWFIFKIGKKTSPKPVVSERLKDTKNYTNKCVVTTYGKCYEIHRGKWEHEFLSAGVKLQTNI